MELKPEVMVVGAGVSGVSLAVALKRRGVSVLLVERDAKVRERYKGEYLQPVAVERLEKLGLGSVLQDAIDSGEANPIRELRFRDLPSQGLISRALSVLGAGPESRGPVSDVLVRYPRGRYGVSIPQHALASRLREVARAELGEHFLEGVDLQCVSRDLEKPHFRSKGPSSIEVRPRLVVGADGRNSSVRGWMGGPKAPASGKPVMGSETEFLVGVDFEAGARLPHRYEVIRTAGEGTFSFFRLTEGRQRLYWNTPDGKAGKQGWRDRVAELLQSSIESELGQKAELGNLAGAPADTAWMGPAGKGRFLLIGDALAVTTPLGGQGMAFALEHVERLALEIPGLFHRAKTVRFSREGMVRVVRRHHAASRRYFRHINLMNLFLYHLCFSRSPVARRLSRLVFAHWNAHPEDRELVSEYFAGTRVEGLNPMTIADLLGLPSLARVRGLMGLRGLA